MLLVSLAVEARISLISVGFCRSSKSAIHGLIHWLAGAYGNKGITVNGVAPALIEDTKMLPRSAELAASKSLSSLCQFNPCRDLLTDC